MKYETANKYFARAVFKKWKISMSYLKLILKYHIQIPVHIYFNVFLLYRYTKLCSSLLIRKPLTQTLYIIKQHTDRQIDM